ncbi:MAG: OmpA family protein [Bacteroidia bacterium]|nr:OmpA family protein [Bacteroidia bacterium]
MYVTRKLITLSFCIAGLTSWAQKIELPDARKSFEQAEKLFIQENFKQALPLYLYSDSLSPVKDNANLAYKIGVCYLNSAADKIKSIPYLERAVKNTSTSANEDAFKEKSAPIDAYYQLAHAYHLNYQLDYAISNFGKFKNFIVESDIATIDNVNHQIEMCNNAKTMVATPVTIKIDNLGPNVNSPYPDYSAVVSADESSLFFTSRRPGTTGGGIDPADGKYYEDIYFCTKKDSAWTPSENIGFPINSFTNDATIGVSVDGQRLLIYRDDNGDGNIYTSQLKGGSWTTPAKMSENINTQLWEPSASISADGTRLYFASNREGGFGGRDIYMSKQLPNGQWSKAVNLGPTINTKYDEDAPFIHPDGVTLFFSSMGHKSMGGFDIFFCTINNETDKVTSSVNIGYPVNSTDDDVFYTPTADNKRAYYSSFKAGGYGEKDIYMITFPEQKETPLTVYRGKIKSIDGTPVKNVEITVIDNETGQLVGTYFPNSKTGNYLFILSPGKNYNISYQAEGYLLQSENMDVPKDSTYNLINTYIELKPVTVGQRVVLKNIFFDYNKSTLRPISRIELDKFYKMLNEKPLLVIEISGHTDSKGNDKFNLKLSQSRAQAVVDYLVKKGIDKKRMVAIGYGETIPIAKNTKPDGKEDPVGMQLNRRVEYHVLSTEGELNMIEKIKVPDALKIK